MAEPHQGPHEYHCVECGIGLEQATCIDLPLDVDRLAHALVALSLVPAEQVRGADPAEYAASLAWYYRWLGGLHDIRTGGSEDDNS